MKSAFNSTHSQTLDLLERELRHLAAKNVVFQMDVSEDDIRLDGCLRATARPRSPAIAISFDSRHGSLTYPCDRFDDWRDNVRAIALALQALRLLDRYGVSGKAEQYRGWQQLPPPSKQVEGFASVHAAADFLVSVGGGIAANVLRDSAYAHKIWRNACAATHPDRYPSLAGEYRRVGLAYEMIKESS